VFAAALHVAVTEASNGTARAGCSKSILQACCSLINPAVEVVADADEKGAMILSSLVLRMLKLDSLFVIVVDLRERHQSCRTYQRV